MFKMSFSKFTVAAFLSTSYVDAQDHTSFDFSDMMEVWAEDGPPAGPTPNTTWSTSFDFIKSHGCNCPALFDEFAIGGTNKDDALDMSCHNLRQCLSCSKRDTTCENEDINTLSFNWKWTDKAICNANQPCESLKCECYVDFLNNLIDNYATNSKVAVAGNVTTCVAKSGTLDSCCKQAGEWKLYDSNMHVCHNNAIGQLPQRNYAHMKVNPNVDWTMTFLIKIDQAKTPGWISIFHVGDKNEMRLPGLWFHNDGELDLHFVTNCEWSNFNNQQPRAGGSARFTPGWKVGETHLVKVEYLKSSSRTKLYSDNILMNEVLLNDCGTQAEQTLWFSDPWYLSSGDFTTITNINFEYV